MATVTTQTNFRSAITARDPEIILANNITLTTLVNISYTVTIRGATAGLSLFWGNPTTSSRDMLIISATGNLTIDSIILDAQGRDGTLVQINGGTFTMNGEAIIRNVKGTTGQSGVSIGNLSNSPGGTFIMNGGLITGIDSADSVFSAGGTIIMNNDAAISNNPSSGMGIATPSTGGPRASLTMTGTSHINGNRSIQAGGGILLLDADIYMGINDGDAPEIYDNRPPSGSYGGAIVANRNCTITMDKGAKIWGNYSDLAGGGIIAQDSLITMKGNSSIVENVCDGAYGGGGVRIHSGSKLLLEDNASVSNNTSKYHGGGVYLQPGGALEMKGNSVISNNAGADGAGIYLGAPTASVTSITSAIIGSDNSSPVIHNNIATRNGGGIFSGRFSKLNLMGNSIIRDNEATLGAGIYKEGEIYISQSPKILDGLYFRDMETADETSYRDVDFFDMKIVTETSTETSESEFPIILKSIEYKSNFDDTEEPKYTNNAPVISAQLTSGAEIILDSSPYVSPENVPLVIAVKGEDYDELGESDRVVWEIPENFGAEYNVVLNEELNQVLITLMSYNINYCHLYGAENPNPDSYNSGSTFPIVLQPPRERDGYEFLGWTNCSGEIVTV